MTDPITSGLRTRNSAVGTNQSTKADGSANADAASGGSKSSGDVVEITSSALMQSIEEQIQNTASINQEKIDTVKQAIADGEYQPDAEVIAKKYAEIEELLP